MLATRTIAGGFLAMLTNKGLRTAGWPLVAVVLASCISGRGAVDPEPPPSPGTEALVVAEEGIPTPDAEVLPGDIAYTYMPGYGTHNFHIRSIDEDGSDDAALISAKGVGLNQAAWSPDGGKLASWGWLNHYTISIYSFNVDGTGLTRLTTTNNVYDMFPAWSPDDTRITFTRQYPDEDYRTEIWIVGSDGSGPRFVAEGYQSKWSADGNGLIFVSADTGNYEIYTSKADGSGRRRLTSTAINEQDPAWSPDGTRIAYAAFTDDASTYEIFSMGSDGTDVVRLTNNTCLDMCPRWSPDGSRIVFNSDLSAARHNEIYVMRADGSGRTRLTFSSGTSTSAFPSWNPAKK